MCKAVEDMMNEREELGKAEGREEGRAEGREEGRAEGRAEGKVAALSGLVKDGLISMKEAAIRADMTESAFEAEMKRLFNT